MTKPIRRACVVGAGVMGSGIAAHLANAGIEVLLLDIVPPNLTDAERTKKSARDRFAAGERAILYLGRAADRRVRQRRLWRGRPGRLGL